MRPSKHRGWRLYKRNPSARASACINLASGKLIQFAQLSRDKAATLEIEKSLHETSLRINKMQEAARLQLGLRLHDSLGRSLALIKPNSTTSAPPEEQVQQIRTLLRLVYPAGAVTEIPEKSATPLGRLTRHASELTLKKHRDGPTSRHRSG